MSRSPAEIQHFSTRELLVRRVRIVLGICILGAVVFAALDLSSWRPEMLPSFAVKLVGTSMAVLGIVLMAQQWVVRRTWGMAVFVVSVCYVVTAVDRMLRPAPEYPTTALLFLGAPLTTSGILPWGATGQPI